MSIKEDFVDWKRHPITQIVMGQLHARYETLKEQLVERAASVPQEELAELAGGAKAYRDIISISFEDIEEESHGS